jgi:hypothetical protein
MDKEIALIIAGIIFTISLMSFGAHVQYTKYKGAKIIIEGCKNDQ